MVNVQLSSAIMNCELERNVMKEDKVHFEVLFWSLCQNKFGNDVK
jgi:hypothetical protein